MTNDLRALKIKQGLSCSLRQLALDYLAARRKLVAEAKASAASLGIDPETIGIHEQDSTHTMEGVHHD